MFVYEIRGADGGLINTLRAENQQDADAFAPRGGAAVALVVPPLPPVPVFATAEAARAAMIAWINNLTNRIQNQYPEVVQKGWEEEEAMAAAYMAGTEDDQQRDTLTRDAQAKQRSPAEHAVRILENAQLFRSIARETRRLWLAVDGMIDAAADPMEYDQILEWAKEEAAPLVAAHGL